MKNAIRLLLIILFLSINCRAQNAVNIRGQVQYYNISYNQYYTLPNAIVDLYVPTPSGYRFLSQTITNGYGLYFFYHLLPGNYLIQINRAKNYQIQVFYPNSDFLDIPICFY
ncbi:hypothetical protein [Flavobacterium sp. N1736]|uniref:hypothetical protein n=1 Tax=Flavobacterium sp. N1736 TaxID=2986823 RepID=UPI002223F711|nr:hypothetical protein [Flavobacterium sp. N1736]